MNPVRSFLFNAERTLSEVRWPKYFIVVTGLLSTVFLTFYLQRIENGHRIREFEYICRDASMRILTRLQSHELVLKTAAAFFESSDSVTYHDWQDFVTRSDIFKILPGIRGVGYTTVSNKAVVDDSIQTSILYLETSDGRNRMLIGYDLFTDSECRSAMAMSRDSDMSSISGQPEFVQTGEQAARSGLIMFSPVFSKYRSLETTADKMAALQGWTFNPFRMDELVNGIQGMNYFLEEAGIQLEIYSGDSADLLFESQNFYESSGKVREYSMSIPLNFNGSEYVLRFNKKSESFIFSSREIIILTSGIIITILVFLLFVLLINTGKNARKLALQLTKELKSRERDLIRINATKDRLYSIIAHDLRSPFNAIIGLTDIIGLNLEKKEPEKAAILTKLVNSNAEQTLILLENLLAWTKSQTGQIDYRPGIHFLAPVIQRVIDVMNTSASIKNISLTCNVPEKVHVYADPSMLEIILRNLVSNAIKFTNTGGKVEISASENKLNCEIIVQDNGIGMSPETVEKLFQTASGTSTIGTSNEKGSGLGLLLCREFCGKHGGNIRVESRCDSGSRFIISLPALS